jgi:hypothetical protein
MRLASRLILPDATPSRRHAALITIATPPSALSLFFAFRHLRCHFRLRLAASAMLRYFRACFYVCQPLFIRAVRSLRRFERRRAVIIFSFAIFAPSAPAPAIARPRHISPPRAICYERRRRSDYHVIIRFSLSLFHCFTEHCASFHVFAFDKPFFAATFSPSLLHFRPSSPPMPSTILLSILGRSLFLIFDAAVAFTLALRASAVYPCPPRLLPRFSPTLRRMLPCRHAAENHAVSSPLRFHRRRAAADADVLRRQLRLPHALQQRFAQNGVADNTMIFATPDYRLPAMLAL